ncbi:MAG: GNAT family protein [archaeon]
MKLETKRLILRYPRKSDWKDIVEGIKDIKVSRYLTTVPYPYKKKDADWWINDCIKRSRKKKKESYNFVIELKSEKKVIGGTGLHKINLRDQTAETGSWIAKKYWRNHFITEAKIAVNNYAFNKLKLRKLTSKAFTTNKASNTMLKKLGYKLEGTLRKAHRPKSTGKIHDVNVYGLLKEEWKTHRKELIKYLNKKLK